MRTCCAAVLVLEENCRAGPEITNASVAVEFAVSGWLAGVGVERPKQHTRPHTHTHRRPDRWEARGCLKYGWEALCLNAHSIEFDLHWGPGFAAGAEGGKIKFPHAQNNMERTAAVGLIEL